MTGYALLALLIALARPSLAQNDELGRCNLMLRELTGEAQVLIDGKTVSLKDRSILVSGSDRELARDYIVTELQKRGLEPEIRSGTIDPANWRHGGNLPPLTFSNVIVRVPAKPGSTQSKKVILGAHYDVVNSTYEAWRSSRFGKYRVTPGADDNGSGVVGLFALIDRFHENPPDHPVEVIFFDAEEPSAYGLALGSGAHARQLALQGDSSGEIAQVLILDMIGKKPFGKFSYNLSAANYASSDLSRLTQTLKTDAGPKAAIHTSGDRNYIAELSDSRNFIYLGVPTILISDILDLRDLPGHYHTEWDQVDNIDFQYMKGILDQAEILVRSTPLMKGKSKWW